MRLSDFLHRLRSLVASHKQLLNAASLENRELMLGKLLSNAVRGKANIASLKDIEFKVFSQFGDDGIIQWLLQHLNFPNQTFVEFGVENYQESNTRFLMCNDNWSGVVIDGSKANIAQIVNSHYFWKFDLRAKAAFIDQENINSLLLSFKLEKDVGVLHIDLDGNDFWIWKTIDVISPVVVILEYNGLFGADRSITVPYDKTFRRTNAHYSNLYFGASLPALHQLSSEKGYAFIGCNSAGNNAYFVRRDKLTGAIQEVSLAQGYVEPKFRQSRAEDGHLTHLTGPDQAEEIRGLPVYRTDTGEIEPF